MELTFKPVKQHKPRSVYVLTGKVMFGDGDGYDEFVITRVKKEDEELLKVYILEAEAVMKYCDNCGHYKEGYEPFWSWKDDLPDGDKRIPYEWVENIPGDIVYEGNPAPLVEIKVAFYNALGELLEVAYKLSDEDRAFIEKESNRANKK